MSRWDRLKLEIQVALRRWYGRLYWWVVSLLPKWMVKMALLKAGVHGTTGIYGETEVPGVAFVTILERWTRR